MRQIPTKLYLLRHKEEGWFWATRPNQRRGDMVNRLRHVKEPDKFEVIELFVDYSKAISVSDFLQGD